MSDIRDAVPRLRQMNDVLEENERLLGRLAWTERERDSLRRSIKNLSEYMAELNDEIERLRGSIHPQPYEKSDEKRVLCDTKNPRNGALSGCETVPDPDSRVWETPRTPQPHTTQPKGSVHGEGSFRDSRNAKEPVAWAVAGDYGEYAVKLCFDEASAALEADRRCRVGLRPDYVVVPLYRHTQPTLTDAEREALESELELAEYQRRHEAPILRGLLERLGGER